MWQVVTLKLALGGSWVVPTDDYGNGGPMIRTMTR